MADLETIRVTSTETECGYLIINAADFVDGEHEPFDAPAAETIQRKGKRAKVSVAAPLVAAAG